MKPLRPVKLTVRAEFETIGGKRAFVDVKVKDIAMFGKPGAVEAMVGAAIEHFEARIMAGDKFKRPNH